MNDEILEHYRLQAERFGESPESTMLDQTVREKEMEVLLGELKQVFPVDSRVLEVGCGNGYALAQVHKAHPRLRLEAVDACKEMVCIANGRGLKGVTIKEGDVEHLDYPDGCFDVVYSERCLINLDRVGQAKALSEIWRVLRDGGKYIMIEAMTDGWRNLNQAREDVGLPPIPIPFHNTFFDRDLLMAAITGKFWVTREGNFLSAYFFGSRVLYPALLRGQALSYNTKFVEFFKYLEPHGNFGHIYLYVLEKRMEG